MANGTDVNAGIGMLGAADQAQIDQGTPTPQPSVPQAPPAPGLSAMGAVSPQPQQQPAARPGPRPGSFGWKLAQVLGGVKDAMDSLGDVGAVGKAPEGAGPLYGATRALAARTERLRMVKEYQDKQAVVQREQARLDENQRMEQQKTQAYLAHEAIMTYKDQLVAHTMEDEYKGKMSELGKKIFNEYATPAGGGTPAKVYAEGLSVQEAAARARQLGKENGWDMTQQHIFPTGTEPVVWGRNADGSPQMRMMPTYSLVGDSPAMKPSEEVRQELADILYPDIKDKQERLDKIPTTLKGREFGQLYTRAAGALTQQTALQKMRADAGLGEMLSTSKLELLKHTEALHTLADALHKDKDVPPTYEDLQLAAQKMEHDGTWAGAQGKLRAAVFGTEADPLGFKAEQVHKDEILKALNQQRLEAQELERERHDRAQEEIERLKATLGQNLAGLGASLTTDMANQIANLPDDKKRVLNQIQDNDLKATIMSLAFGPGDLDMDKVFPNRKYRGSTDISLQNAVGIVQQLNPNRSEQQYRLVAQAYQKVTTGDLGAQIGQYNNVLEHMGEAQDVIESTWRNVAPKFMIKPLNTISRETYGTQIAAIDAALAPVRSEFAQLMAGGYKPSEEESKAYQTLSNSAARPDQLETAFKVIANTGAIRLGNINQQYKRIAGNNIPGILTDDSMAAARKINSDAATMQRLGRLDVGGTLFHNPNWKSNTHERMEMRRPGNAVGTIAMPDGTSRYYDKDHNIIDSDGNISIPAAQTGYSPVQAGLQAGVAALNKK